MKHRFGSGLVGTMLALLVAVALAATGMAHRPLALSDSTFAPDLAAYLATGGSVEDLCGRDTGPAIQRDHCPVCTLPGDLPGPVTAQAAQAVARTADRVTLANTPPTPTACHPAWNGRAPPVV